MRSRFSTAAVTSVLLYYRGASGALFPSCAHSLRLEGPQHHTLPTADWEIRSILQGPAPMNTLRGFCMHFVDWVKMWNWGVLHVRNKVQSVARLLPAAHSSKNNVTIADENYFCKSKIYLYRIHQFRELNCVYGDNENHDFR